MLQPKKQKYRKVHRARAALRGKAKGDTSLVFGSFGLKTITPGELTSRQIESARKAINGHLNREGKLWIRPFPHKVITRKAAEVPMGSGKGYPEFYVAPLCPGRIIFELEGVDEDKAREAFRLAMHKLPFICKFITKEW
jgi:large subunit ribosomal protein L16